jgi:hypothetical protein
MHNLIGIDQNPKLGFYKVNAETFYSKPQAYARAHELGVRPTWHFNTVEFAKQDWTQEPETNLREIYRLRAEQIRQKYDYVRLDLSGGSDSVTVLYAFVLNNIPLDEVVFRYPKSGEKGVCSNPHDYRPENTLSEYEFAAKPLLKWIATNYPQIKITVFDYSENMLRETLQDESWIFSTRDWFQPGHSAKHNIFAAEGHRAQADSGKNICVLHGVDKPKVVTINNNWYTYFVDVFANQPSPIMEDYTNITHELFFWTPDMPELLIKQSHMIKAWFDMPGHDSFRHLVKYPQWNPNRRTAYESIVKSIIYPDFDPLTWQTSKATNSFYNEMDHWFYTNYKDTTMHQTWLAGLEYLTEQVGLDQMMYKNGMPVGLKWNKSLFYHLGPSISQAHKPAFVNQGHMANLAEEITLWQDRKIQHIVV